MTQLENVIVSMVTVFEGYAGVDADKMKLNNSELSTLLKEQLKNPDFQSKLHPNDVKEAMEIMDKNCDGQVSFNEFSQCVCRLAQGYYCKKYGKEKGKGKCK